LIRFFQWLLFGPLVVYKVVSFFEKERLLIMTINLYNECDGGLWAGLSVFSFLAIGLIHFFSNCQIIEFFATRFSFFRWLGMGNQSDIHWSATNARFRSLVPMKEISEMFQHECRQAQRPSQQLQ